MDIMAKQRRMIIAVIFAFFFCFFLLRTGSAHAVSPPEDIDYGLSMDEQQGGSGLVGDVVRILNGNNIENRQDISFPSPNRMGLSFDATYNSLSGTTGYLGFGWTHTYEVSVDPSFEIESETYVRILDSTGRALYFVEQGGGVYGGAFKERSYVKEESGEYIWYRLDGNRYGFSGPGRLNWIEDGKSGTSLVMSYDAQDRLDTVTDTSSGRDLTFQYNANGRLESVSGPITNAVPSGIWVTYAYDADQNLVSVTYADGSGFDYTYTDPNDIHNLTEKRDKLNHLLKSFTYDTQDRVTDNFCVEGRGASINYVSATGIEVTDAYGTLRTYTLSDMDGRKRITAMTGVGGAPYSQNNAVRWQYDTQMRLTEVEYKGGTINQYQAYDERGNPGTVKLAAGTPDERVISYTYHEDMNVPLTRTEAGVLAGGNKVTIWDYDNDYDETPNEDPAILLSRIIEQGFTKDASGTNIGYEYITAFTYNTKGQVLSIDGPKQGTGDITSFAYNSTTGNLLSITRPLIGPTSFSDYDNAGYPGRIEDVNGREKTFSYDGRGRITGITNVSDGSTTSIVYNPAGKQESVTDPDGITKTYAYDGTYGGLTRVTDPEGNYMAYDYDTQGNRIEKSKHYSSGERTSLNRWTYEHPVMPGKLYKEINADDTFTEYGYDSEGNVASVTDARDHTTTYEYDPFNRLYKVTQPGTMITSYAYDSHGNLIEVIDAQGHETTYVYDDMGRLVSTTSPDTGTMTYVYDEAGNLVEKTDAKGILVSYTYDLLNRLTAVHFPDSSQDITYTWDTGANGMGQLGAMTDTSGSMTFDYDNRGRLAQKTSTIGSRSFDLAYAYTPADRLSTFTYPTGRTVDYTRNSRGHIEGATTTLNDVSTTLAENIVYGGRSVRAGAWPREAAGK
jgi:YD repeat-containing protein